MQSSQRIPNRALRLPSIADNINPLQSAPSRENMFTDPTLAEVAQGSRAQRRQERLGSLDSTVLSPLGSPLSLNRCMMQPNVFLTFMLSSFQSTTNSITYEIVKVGLVMLIIIS